MEVFNPITGSIDTVSIDTDYNIKLDDTGTALYVGKALPGSSTSSAVWQIKKVTDTTISFADAVSTFTKVWNDRASYTY